MSDWFNYTPWGYFTFNKPRTRTQYYAQSFIGGLLPPVGAYHRARDDMAYMDDYLKNRGFDYDYIKYPSRTVGYAGVSGLGSGVRSVSSNVTSLYSDNKRWKKRMKGAFEDGRYYERASRYRWDIRS